MLHREKVLSGRWECVSVAPHRLRRVPAWEYQTHYVLLGKIIWGLRKTYHKMFRGENYKQGKGGIEVAGEEKSWENREIRG